MNTFAISLLFSCFLSVIYSSNIFADEPDSTKAKQWIELRGDVAANITGNDSTNSGSGSGGMIWNYLFETAQLRISTFYSITSIDTIRGDKPKIYGSSLLNPFLGEGAKIKVEYLNLWKWNLFAEPKFGFYFGATFNQLTWQGQRQAVDNEGSLIDDSVFVDTQEGQNTIFRVGANFTPVDDVKVGEGNSTALQFELGFVSRVVDGDLGLGKNRRFRNTLLGKAPTKSAWFWGVDLGAKLRFNQLFAEIRYSYLNGKVPGLSDPRVVVRAGLDARVLRLNLKD